MGARPYDPALGRFYAVDPVESGSANNYDYTWQDPINAYDITGECVGRDLPLVGKVVCPHPAQRRAREAVAAPIRRVARDPYVRVCRRRGLRWGPGGGQSAGAHLARRLWVALRASCSKSTGDTSGARRLPRLKPPTTSLISCTQADARRPREDQIGQASLQLAGLRCGRG